MQRKPITAKQSGDKEGHALFMAGPEEMPLLLDPATWPFEREHIPNLEQLWRSHTRERASWYGGLRSKEAAVKLMQTGWRGGADRVRQLADDVRKQDGGLPLVPSRVRRRLWTDDGDELDIDRLRQRGVDVAWQRHRRTHCLGASSVTIIGQWGGNCGDDSDTLFWRGAATLALTDVLETAGYRVEIMAVSQISFRQFDNMPYGPAYTVIPLKQLVDPVNMDALAATLAHAGTFRTVGLAAVHAACPTPLSDYANTTHGHQGSLSTACDVLVKCGYMAPAPIMLGEGIYSKQSAVSAIRREIEQLNAMAGGAA